MKRAPAALTLLILCWTGAAAGYELPALCSEPAIAGAAPKDDIATVPLSELRVRTEKGGELVLCGDACYLKESLDRMHTPGVVFDRDAMLDVFRRFREMQSRGMRIMYGHDPDFWKSVPQAPVRLG